MKKLNYVLLSATIAYLVTGTANLGVDDSDFWGEGTTADAWAGSADMTTFNTKYGLSTSDWQSIRTQQPSFGDINRVFKKIDLEVIISSIGETAAQKIQTILTLSGLYQADPLFFDTDVLTWLLIGSTTPNAKKQTLIQASRKPLKFRMTAVRATKVLDNLHLDQDKKEIFNWYAMGSNAAAVNPSMKATIFSELPDQTADERKAVIGWYNTRNAAKYASVKTKLDLSGATPWAGIGLSKWQDVQQAIEWCTNNANMSNYTAAKSTAAKKLLMDLLSWNDQQDAALWYAKDTSSGTVNRFIDKIGSFRRSSWPDRKLDLEQFALIQEATLLDRLFPTSSTDNPTVFAGYRAMKKDGFVNDFPAVTGDQLREASLWYAKPGASDAYKKANSSGIPQAILATDRLNIASWHLIAQNIIHYQSAQRSSILLGLTTWADIKDAVAWYTDAVKATQFNVMKNANIPYLTETTWKDRQELFELNVTDLPARVEEYKGLNSTAISFKDYVDAYNDHVLEGLAASDVVSGVSWWESVRETSARLAFTAAYNSGILRGLTTLTTKDAAVAWYTSNSARFNELKAMGFLKAIPWTTPSKILKDLVLDDLPSDIQSMFQGGEDKVALLVKYIAAKQDTKGFMRASTSFLQGLTTGADLRAASLWYDAHASSPVAQYLNISTDWAARLLVLEAGNGEDISDLLEEEVKQDDGVAHAAEVALNYDKAVDAGFISETLAGGLTGSEKLAASDWYKINYSLWANYKTLVGSLSIELAASWPTRLAILNTSDVVPKRQDFNTLMGTTSSTPVLFKAYLDALDAGLLTGLTPEDVKKTKDALQWYVSNSGKFALAQAAGVLLNEPWKDQEALLKRTNLSAELVEFSALSATTGTVPERFSDYIKAKDAGILVGVTADQTSAIAWYKISGNAALYTSVTEKLKKAGFKLSNTGNWQTRVDLLNLGSAELTSVLRDINLTAGDKSVFFTDYIQAYFSGILGGINGPSLSTFSDKEAAVIWYKTSSNAQYYTSTVQSVLDQSQGWAACLAILNLGSELEGEINTAKGIYTPLNNADFNNYLNAGYAKGLTSSEDRNLAAAWYAGLTSSRKLAINFFVSSGLLDAKSSYGSRLVTMDRPNLIQEINDFTAIYGVSVTTEKAGVFSRYLITLDQGLLEGLGVVADKKAALTWYDLPGSSNKFSALKGAGFYDTALAWSVRQGVLDGLNVAIRMDSNTLSEIENATTMKLTKALFKPYLDAKAAGVLTGLTATDDLIAAITWYAQSANMVVFSTVKDLGFVDGFGVSNWSTRLATFNRGDLAALTSVVGLLTGSPWTGYTLTPTLRLIFAQKVLAADLLTGLSGDERERALSWYFSEANQANYLLAKNAGILDWTSNWTVRYTVLSESTLKDLIQEAKLIFGTSTVSPTSFISYLDAKKDGVFTYVSTTERRAALTWYQGVSTQFASYAASSVLTGLVTLADVQAAFTWYASGSNSTRFSTYKDYLDTTWSFAKRRVVLDSPYVDQMMTAFSTLSASQRTQAAFWAATEADKILAFTMLKESGVLDDIALWSSKQWIVDEFRALKEGVTSDFPISTVMDIALLAAFNSRNGVSVTSMTGLSAGKLLHTTGWAKDKQFLTNAATNDTAALSDLLKIPQEVLSQLYTIAFNSTPNPLLGKTGSQQAKLLFALSNKAASDANDFFAKLSANDQVLAQTWYDASTSHQGLFAAGLKYLTQDYNTGTWDKVLGFINTYDSLYKALSSLEKGAFVTSDTLDVVSLLVAAELTPIDISYITLDEIDASAFKLSTTTQKRAHYLTLKSMGVFEKLTPDTAQARDTIVTATLSELKTRALRDLISLGRAQSYQERIQDITDTLNMDTVLGKFYGPTADVILRRGLIEGLKSAGVPSADISQTTDVADLSVMADYSYVSHRVTYFTLRAMHAFASLLAFTDRKAFVEATSDEFASHELYEKKSLFNFSASTSEGLSIYMSNIMGLDYGLESGHFYDLGSGSTLSMPKRKILIEALHTGGKSFNDILGVNNPGNLPTDPDAHAAAILALVE